MICIFFYIISFYIMAPQYGTVAQDISLEVDKKKWFKDKQHTLNK